MLHVPEPVRPDGPEVPCGVAGLVAAAKLARRLIGPNHVWVPTVAGFAGQMSAVAYDEHRRLFIKWAHLEKGRAPLVVEAANLRLLGASTPGGSPQLVAFEGALATDAVETGRQVWSRETVLSAAGTLVELATAPSSATYVPDELLPTADGTFQEGASRSAARQAPDIDGLLRRALTLVRPTELSSLFGSGGEVTCHADAHARNWVIDRQDRAVLVDFGHLCRGPAGWDLGTLLACLGTAPRDRTVTAEWAATLIAGSAHAAMTRRAAAAWWLRLLHMSCRRTPSGRFAQTAVPFATQLVRHLHV